MVAAMSGGGNDEITEEVVELDVIERRDSEALGGISASLLPSSLELDFGYGVLHFAQFNQTHSIPKCFSFCFFFFCYFIFFSSNVISF